MRIDFSALTAAEFTSSAAAVLITGGHPGELENGIIAAILHKDGTLHNIAFARLDQINFDNFDAPAKIVDDDTRNIAADLVARLVGVADAENAERAIRALDRLADVLETNGVTVANRIMTPKIASGQECTDLGTGEYGILPDPALTPPAIAALIDGHSPRPEPEELARLFAPLPPADIDAARSEQSANPDDFARATLAQVRQLIADYASTYDRTWGDSVIGGEHAHDERARILDSTAHGTAANIAAAIEISGSALDTLLGLATLDIPAAARIYTHIATQLEGVPAARMLCVAAVVYYVDGREHHGHHALVQAVGVALDEDGDMSEYLPVIGRALIACEKYDTATEVARGWLVLGTAAAKDYGIEVPGYNMYPNE